MSLSLQISFESSCFLIEHNSRAPESKPQYHSGVSDVEALTCWELGIPVFDIISSALMEMLNSGIWRNFIAKI